MFLYEANRVYHFSLGMGRGGRQEAWFYTERQTTVTA